MDTGEIIYKAFAPTLKMMSTIGIGFALAKSGALPPSAAKGVSIVALNVSIPALIWSSMVESFNQDNISAFGGLALAAIVYQIIGAALAWLITEIFHVPTDFRYGAIVVCRPPTQLTVDGNAIQLGQHSHSRRADCRRRGTVPRGRCTAGCGIRGVSPSRPS